MWYIPGMRTRVPSFGQTFFLIKSVLLNKTLHCTVPADSSHGDSHVGSVSPAATRTRALALLLGVHLRDQALLLGAPRIVRSTRRALNFSGVCCPLQN